MACSTALPLGIHSTSEWLACSEQCRFSTGRQTDRQASSNWRCDMRAGQQARGVADSQREADRQRVGFFASGVERWVRSVQTSAMFDVERTTGVLRSAFASERYRAALVHDLPQPLDWTTTGGPSPALGGGLSLAGARPSALGGLGCLGGGGVPCEAAGAPCASAPPARASETVGRWRQ